MQFTYGKKDKLKSQKQIAQLFKDGKGLTVFPLRVVYLPITFEDGSLIKAGVSVSKRLHKKAVARNRLKRLMREAYRLNKPLYFNNTNTSFAFMFLYISKEFSTFKEVEAAMIKIFKKIIQQYENTL